MKKRVLTVAANSKYSHSSLALRYFRENSGCDIFECSINDNIFDIYSQLYALDYEILCFSVYIWNVEFILKLAPMLKSVKPDLKIVFGGPEAGYNCEEILNKYYFVDGIISGEGEYAIKKIVEGAADTDIPNYVYKNKGNIVYNEKIKTNLSEISFPYKKRDIEILKNKIIYFETSRGCCFKCSYCLSSSEGKTRYFDMEYVKKGLDFFIENHVPLVKFVDRTFNENDERSCEILNYVIHKNRGTKFHFEISPLLLTEKFCNLLEKAKDFVQLEIGIQTTNVDTMKSIRRIFEIENIRNKINMIPEGVHTHMDLIAGLPHETIKTFESGFDFVYSLKPDMLQLGFLKLLHNTQLKSEADEHNMKTIPFPPYEIISTNTMPADEIILLKKTEKAVDRIYNSGVFENTLKKLEGNFELFRTIGLKLADREIEGPVSRIDLYEFMYNLFGDRIKEDLVKDFLINNPKSPLPKVLKDDFVDFKKIHKIIVKKEKFGNVKFRVEAACGKCFVVHCGNVDIFEISDLYVD